MSKLHHKAARYEVQVYIEHTMSWRPVYHTNDLAEAKAQSDVWAGKAGTGYANTRVLDRIKGASNAEPVEFTGRTCQYCDKPETGGEEVEEFTTRYAGDESAIMCESCTEHYE